MLIAEMIRRLDKYDTFKYNKISFTVFNTWLCGSHLQMLFAKNKYIEMCLMMGEVYDNALNELIISSNIADDISKAAETKCIANPIKKTRYIIVGVRPINSIYRLAMVAIVIGGWLCLK